jgi:hypothetical protein
MASIALFDPTDQLIPNRVTAYLASVNTPDYDNIGNKLINPDISGLPSTFLYWKVSNEVLIEMATDEKQLIDDKVLYAKSFLEKKFRVTINDASFRMTSDTYYNVEDGDGTFSKKVDEYLYTYEVNNLVTRVYNSYYRDGSLYSTITTTYYSDGRNQIEKKDFS